jgi:PEGA domain
VAVFWATSSPPALGAGPAVMVDGLGGIAAPRLKAISESVARYRSVVEPQPLPPPGVSPEQAAIEERGQAVRLALVRARKKESEALWDDCVREVAGVMSDAIEVIASTGELTLLRDLHVQAGICMSLADQAPSARLHFLVAALLDESPPQTGLHRQEAERAQADARDEILARPRGKLRIVTDPPGARVLVDGREVSGTTPLVADVRLGDHFVTIQRFRYEPNTEQRFLQPFGLVRVNLEPARRSTLSDQLAKISSGRLPAPSPEEVRLAQAVWSRAEQVLTVSHDESATGSDRLSLAEGATGKLVRSAVVAPHADNASLRHAVCDVLGENCEASRGIPWYVWPLAGAVVIGGVVTTAVILENNRDTRFCPPVGCR